MSTLSNLYSVFWLELAVICKDNLAEYDALQRILPSSAEQDTLFKFLGVIRGCSSIMRLVKGGGDSKLSLDHDHPFG